MGYNIDDEKVVWPVGAADDVTLAYATTQAVTIKNRLTVLKFATLTGNTTLNLTASAQQQVGDQVILRIPATSNGNDVTLGTAIDGPNIVGVAGKTKTQGFVFDGTSFIPQGAAVQID